MTNRAGIQLFALFFAASAMLTQVAHAWWAAKTLDEAEKEVSTRYADVAQVEARSVLQQMESQAPPILVDVREPAEYAVSHLPGALRIAPGASAAEVVTALGAVQPGSRIVMYCSVGVRSSRLAERARERLLARGASSVANLRGGIFRWHAERLPLVDANGATDAIHGFDRRWSRLLPRQDAPIVLAP